MNFRIAIVGSGAIGSYYGAKLAHGGSDVHFFMRGDLSEIRREGFSVHGKGENFRVAKVNCYNSTEEIGRCDLVLIAVKASSNGAVWSAASWKIWRWNAGASSSGIFRSTDCRSWPAASTRPRLLPTKIYSDRHAL